MNKDIEIVTSNERIYISDLSVYNAVDLVYGSSDGIFDESHEIRLISSFSNDSDDYDYDLSISFSNREKELAEDYFYKIKSILKDIN